MGELTYRPLVDWAMRPVEISHTMDCLGRAINAFGSNISRMAALAVTPAVIAAHALRTPLQEKGIPPAASDLFAGVSAVEMYTLSVPAIQVGMPSLLFNLLTNAWTAFETLAGDLWSDSLNERPRLGFLVLDAEPLPTDNESDKERKLKREMPLPIWRLKDPNFDVRKNMGTMIRAGRKWDFNNRKEAKMAYSKAFGDDQRIADVFENETLGWLGVTRNAIVHYSAHATDEFKRRTKKHPRLSSAVSGGPIPMDAELAVELASSAITQGIALICFVDNWMNNNPA